MNSESKMNEIVVLKIRVTYDERNNLYQCANEMGLSFNTYARKLLLDETYSSPLQADRIMQLMPRLYTTIDEVEDADVRKELKDLGGQICRCLK